MILFSASLDYLSPPSIGSITRLLWSSRMDTCSNNFGTSCGSVWPSMFTFRLSLKIGDCTTCGWCIIQLYRDLFIWWFIFELSFHFGFNSYGVVLGLIALRFYLSSPTWPVAVFFFTYNMVVKRHSDFPSLDLLTGVDVMGYMGLVSVNTSGVETIAASRISFNCCW